MKIFFIGDIFGRVGRKLVRDNLPQIIKKEKVDLVIANAENLTNGNGASNKHLEEMEKAGVDFFTGGNHIFKYEEIFNEKRKNLIRPANYPEGALGKGYYIFKNILIINLMGRIFGGVEGLDCPFRTAEKIIKENPKAEAVIIDFHAETTSEKIALKYFLDGSATAIFGTHTHVATCDAQISDQGTFFVSDVGMTGPIEDSVIGVQKDIIVNKFLTGMPAKHEPVKNGKGVFQGFLLDISNKKVQNFRRIEVFSE